MTKLHAWIDGEKLITLEGIAAIDRNKIIVTTDETVENNTPTVPLLLSSVHWTNSTTATITLEQNVPLERQLYLHFNDIVFPIYPRYVVQTAWFDQIYDASEERLGADYSPASTTFAVWTPTAIQVELLLQTDQRVTMMRKANGVWQTTVTGDLKNVLYQFAVTIHGEKKLINDPYTKGLTANSTYSVVVDLSDSDPPHFHTAPYPPTLKQDAIIYELHVRDATSSADSGVQHKGKFLGLTEQQTTTPAGSSTGLSYIQQLGVTHIQLLPLQDFARVDELNPQHSYNWGYDPLFYFVPEGSYATDAADPLTRITECKQMIHAIHEAGMSVILDVVYNHVYYYESSVYEQLVPGYYFRTNANGQRSNGSGTGNDLATERKMVRKLILDAVDYWLQQFHIDGFRFDLMGAMDITTMQLIEQRAAQMNRPILLLGEGWQLNTPLPEHEQATTSNAKQLPAYSFFNDYFRDTLKGDLFQSLGKGYVNGDGYFSERLPQLVAGSSDTRFAGKLFTHPLQSINFVECHDNHTLADKLSLSNQADTTEQRRRMHQLATGITLLSQGVPFLHAGQEFLRSKQGDPNSYIAGDAINQLNWKLREQEADYIYWVQQLIALRKNYAHFRLTTAREIEQRLHIISTPSPVFGYILLGDTADIAIYVNPLNEQRQIAMPALGRWKQLLSNVNQPTSLPSFLAEQTATIAPYEMLIWIKERT
ncbi:type I pullulanase [Paenibacillus yanchengensis]|uniref:Type I pullulanase n=1 Tax=Paenibacillus yanchengensis TaxID=2035833 RepID=A0ABW4YLU6_9BACL